MCEPDVTSQPSLLYFNQPLAAELGLDLSQISATDLAECFSGNRLPDNAQPIAQAYAGHQFGHFNPQLGDGRAHLLGEIITKQNQRIDIALKGSGRTPYSRGGDGKAGVGPMLREVLISEAMHGLGIPTTRSLAVVGSGDVVIRQTHEPGAVLTRTAASHIRVGTFELYAAKGDMMQVKKLADYSIERHFPHLLNDAKSDEDKSKLESHQNIYLRFFEAVLKKQAALIAQWMSVGFIHGVMNTDNMTISGETIDYGPCAFMDTYYADTVFSSIDEFGRYAYSNQPKIGPWNLAKLAQSLLPLFDEDSEKGIQLAQTSLNQFVEIYTQEWLFLFRNKLGIYDHSAEKYTIDIQLINDWLSLLEDQKVDFTLANRYLSKSLQSTFYQLSDLFNDTQPLESWMTRWRSRINIRNKEDAKIKHRMDQYNPWLIPRNHLVEQALKEAVENNDLTLFTRLMEAWKNPFEENSQYSDLEHPAPKGFNDAYRTFCGT